MKYIKTFEQFIAESVVNEKRINFKGKTAGDLLKVIKNVKSAEFFANGRHYGITPEDINSKQLKDKSVFGTDEDGGEHEIELSDIEFIEIYESFVNIYENAPVLNMSGVKVGDVVDIKGVQVRVLEIYKHINNAIIEFKGESDEDGESTYRYDDGQDDYVREAIDESILESDDGLSKAGHAALGMKQVRIVISGDSVKKNSDKILKFIDKADPNSKCEFYDKTGKIVGTFAKAKMENIKRDIKGLDSKISIEIKNQTLK